MARPIKNKQGGTLMAREPGDPKTGGRKKGTPNRSTIAKQVLAMKIDVSKVSTFNAEALAKLGISTKGDFETLGSLIQALKMLTGDSVAYKTLMDSAYGAPKQETENENRNTIRIEWDE